MDVIIILELGQREEVSPIVLLLINKDLQVLLQLLVDTLSLAIPLIYTIKHKLIKKTYEVKKSSPRAQTMCLALFGPVLLIAGGVG